MTEPTPENLVAETLSRRDDAAGDGFLAALGHEAATGATGARLRRRGHG